MSKVERIQEKFEEIIHECKDSDNGSTINIAKECTKFYLQMQMSLIDEIYNDITNCNVTQKIYKLCKETEENLKLIENETTNK